MLFLIAVLIVVGLDLSGWWIVAAGVVWLAAQYDMTVRANNDAIRRASRHWGKQ